MRLKASLASAIARLAAESVPSPRLNAELLLMFTLGCDRAYLFAHPERELNSDELARYEAALAERARGVPAQYITGHQEFWGMDLIVTPAVLIPRPETEHVIETVLSLAAGETAGGQECPPHMCPPHTRPPHTRIVDVGTGSGAIALALAQEFPDAEVYATDVSAAALEVARANAARHQLEKRIRFHQGDLLEGLALTGLDFVVSNPPYVGEEEEDQVQFEVRKFEPREAVFGGATGVEVITRLLPQAYSALRPGGWLVMEISGTIASAVQHLLATSNDAWEGVEVIPDLQSIPRVVRARKLDRTAKSLDHGAHGKSRRKRNLRSPS
ncbi:MAG TPA: peptide chain release factor N(5)-glutamine methyltransferase [Candidatus Sulfotelmatobacter sp.]|nr:peptide chain release factor N(5)-glutamine methyltransferase [Candidatus Sulfotelmatobacter sp.]